MRARAGRASRVAAGPTAPFAIAALLALALLVSGCGEHHNPAASGEKSRDAEVLNVAIGQEMALAEVYRTVGAHLRNPEAKAIMRRYAAQEAEHIDGWTKALRGLGEELDAETAEVDYSGLRGEADYLRFAYEQTGDQLTHFLEDVTQLSTPAPRSFAASIAANEAQHLVVIRQLLGTGLIEAVPESFDTGEVPPPGETSPATPPGKE